MYPSLVSRMRLSGSVKLRCALPSGSGLGGAGVRPFFLCPSATRFSSTSARRRLSASAAPLASASNADNHGLLLRGALRRAQCRHPQRDDDVDLVRLNGLADLPPARRLNRHRTADRQAHVGVDVNPERSALDQFVKIVAGLGEVTHRLRDSTIGTPLALSRAADAAI
jgi:hypothetical protein